MVQKIENLKVFVELYYFIKNRTSKYLFVLFLTGNCNDDYKRNSPVLSSFAHYEICKNGAWKKRECPKLSLFWNTLQCCIPVSKPLVWTHCVRIGDEKFPVPEDPKMYFGCFK